MASQNLRLGSEHIEAFFQVSRDANPLHRDADYARRTPFGRPVAYGMAAVLRALALCMPEGRRRIASLRCEFRKPLFIDEDYEVSVSGADEQRLRIGRGGIDYLVMTLRTAAWDGGREPAAELRADPMRGTGFQPHAEPIPGPMKETRFEPLTEPRLEPMTDARRVHYAVDPAALVTLQRVFGLEPPRLPAQQLMTLLWMSYCVGMEMPGRQALFADAQVEFSAPPAAGARLSLEIDAAQFDERFNRYSVQARGPGIARLRLVAFRRPSPVGFSVSELPAFEPDERPLQGRTALVTGAARGFGAVMALSCASAGARVLVHHRGAAAGVEPLCAQLRALGAEAAALSVDLEDGAAGKALSAQLSALGMTPDLVVSNAAPPIPEARLVEQRDADILAFAGRNLAISLNTLRPLLPQLPRGAQFVQISTHYLSEAVPGFAHYLAAKGAQEGLIQALAQEFRTVEFIIARLPRMLTDQTNAPFSPQRLAHPGELARRLIRELTRSGPQFRRIDLGE